MNIENGLEFIADILPNVSNILEDEDVKKISILNPNMSNKEMIFKLLPVALKNRKNDVIFILARFKNVDVEEYKNMPLTQLFKDLQELLSNSDIRSFL